MYVKQSSATDKQEVERAKLTFIQWLVDRRDGAPNFEMRKFIILPGGEIPPHMHPNIEHEQYVLRGNYRIYINGVEYRVKEGDVIFIPANTVHSYVNDGPEPAEFLCIVPKVEKYDTIWVEESKAKEGQLPSRC